MAQKDTPVLTYKYEGYKTLSIGADGETANSITNPIIVSSPIGGFTDYESKLLSPGASADGYDVKTTGGMFATVTTSYRTLITNNDSSLNITVYLKDDNSNGIVIGPQATFEVSGLSMSNLYIDTPATYAATIEVIIFG